MMPIVARSLRLVKSTYIQFKEQLGRCPPFGGHEGTGTKPNRCNAELRPILKVRHGPEGIRTLDLSVSLGRPSGTRDKSRSLYLAKLQARGGANWPRSGKHYVTGQPAPHSK